MKTTKIPVILDPSSSLSLTELSKRSTISPEEKERRQLAAGRLKEARCSNPFYANKDDQFWLNFQASRVNVNG